METTTKKSANAANPDSVKQESHTQTGHTPRDKFNAPWTWDSGRPANYDLTWLEDSNGNRILELYGHPSSQKKPASPPPRKNFSKN